MTAIPLPESADLQRRMEARRAREAWRAVAAGYCARPGCGLPEGAGTHEACNVCRLNGRVCLDDDCHPFTVAIAPVPSPPEAMRVVDLIRSTIVRRQGAAYGSLQITEAQTDELARGIATTLLLTFDMKEKE